MANMCAKTAPVKVIAKSGNSKTGAAHVTWAPISGSCSNHCRLKNGGANHPKGPILDPKGKPVKCYGKKGRCGMVNAKLEAAFAKSPVTPEALAALEADGIDRLPMPKKGEAPVPLRAHVVGDCQTPEAAGILGAAMVRYQTRSGARAWTYTHAHPVVPKEAWQGAQVVASCDTMEDVSLARAQGYTAIAVVSGAPRAELPKHSVICPAQAMEAAGQEPVHCNKCTVCSRPRVLVVFRPH